MDVERGIGQLNLALSRLSRWHILGLALLAVALVGVTDYLFGFEISLSIFYLWPVGLATWYAGRNIGFVIALMSAFAGVMADLTEVYYEIHPYIMLWNWILHLTFMLIVAYLLDKLHFHIGVEQQLARLDAVTGINNRRAFIEHLQHHLDLAARARVPITLAYIDIDDFKQTNDRHGHEEGDRVLRAVANTLTESIRRTDVVARLGGDEFAILLVGADRSEAASIITKVRRALAQACELEQFMITCSIGCAIFHLPLPDANSAIRTADTLMYKVKNQGKDAVAFEVISNSLDDLAQPGSANHTG